MSEPVDIWLLDADELARAWPDEAAARPWLASSELARASRFASVQTRRRYIASTWSLRVLLAAAGAAAVRGGEFERNVNGKPFVADGPEFTLSRSGCLALIAITPGVSIGIDLEQLREVSIPPGWRQRFPALAAAATNPARLPRNETEFLRAWTRLEARIKCAGATLGRSLDDPAALESQWRGIANLPGVLHDLEPAHGYVGAVAASTEIDFRLQRIDASTVLHMA